MDRAYQHWIIEGPDRLGKGTLIKNIIREYGYYSYIHYDKPKPTLYYDERESILKNEEVELSPNERLRRFQEESFREGFKMLGKSIKTIFDRFHLGECVYGPLYRDYSGDYVFDVEREYIIPHMGYAQDNTRMVLLTTSNFDIVEDDGESFNFSAKEKEQELFIEAFHKSVIANKTIIDVHDGNGNYKTPEQIFEEAKTLPGIYDIHTLKF